MIRPRPHRLGAGFEHLEYRDLPAAFGIPWADSGHLTLSFVPDGTATPNGPSTLFRSLNAVASTAVWEREILRAFETWASQVNVDVGVVPDNGSPLGSNGAVQGDKRFGDIRIAASSLNDSNELAAASPFSWTGTTFSGDVVFDSSRQFQIGNLPGGYDLYSVTLHEAGHTLGLDHSTAPDSVMHESYGFATGLGVGDIQSVQALYGARSADSFDATKSNNTTATASAIPKDASVANRLTAHADLTTDSDIDNFKFTVPLLGGLTGVSVRVNTEGQSLLTPLVTVYDASGRVVGSGRSTDPTNNDVAISFGTTLLGGSYTVKIDSATNDFGIGGYQLTVDYLTLGSLLAPVTNLLAPVLDHHANDTLSLATLLSPTPKTTPDARFDYTYRAAIEDSTDVDTYKIHSPSASSGGPLNLNAIVWGLDAAALNPRLRVFDSAGNPVAFQMLANDTGIFSLEVLGVAANADYYVQVAGRNPSSTGSYFLGADFNASLPTVFDGVALGSVQTAAISTDAMTIGESGLFVFELAASGSSGGVTMSVIDPSGNAMFSLTASAGQPPVTTIQYLPVGSYIVRYSSTNAATSPVQYDLLLLNLSDPVGPMATTTTSTAPNNPAPAPMAPATTAPPSTTPTPTKPPTTSGYTYSSSSAATPASYWYTF